ncbi:MAG TPA: SusD/RagB family nutrient-binding outer membrane lipoprotein [Ohtaekwangia sp.]|uniref:SusD/RagB family nutrient-binding outer membrane lipoprotein n=1 Tax=Ohtaekwangia sp. TaxID=2066019 RepID=UPI002F944DFF
MKLLYKKLILGFAFAGVVATSCSDEDYVDANTNPDILNEVPPENQFLSATISLHSQDFEAFYDTYRRIMPWMQYVTPQNGNGASFTSNIDNFSQRYGRLYTGIGDALVDMEKLVEKLPEEDQPKYVHMLSIARILKAYYTFYVSDIYGSIPYSEAWQARYGGTMLPKYDDQQTLFNTLDQEIEQSVTALNTAQSITQVSLGNYDQYYKGDVKSWVRAGNALRLKIAMRLIKRDASKTQTIAQEVLSQAADNLMSSNSQGWVFKGTAGFTSGGNWNPDLLYSTKPLVDFMWNTNDPRIDAFFSPNGYSQANINALIADGQLPAGTVEASRRYFGGFTSPDDSKAAINKKYYTPRTVEISGSDVQVDTLSLIQRRLFQPSFDEGNGIGDGLVYLPIITYAEFCFMRAELAARSITSEDAETFYNAGVTASIMWYNQIAVDGELSNYTALGGSEISDYLSEPAVAFDNAKALDQISSQAFLNFYKQPAEGWGLWKRNGMPNATTSLVLPDLKSNGATLPIPRRAPLLLLSQASANYVNQKAAYDAMAQDAGFGAGPTDAFGRVWWDEQ